MESWQEIGLHIKAELKRLNQNVELMNQNFAQEHKMIWKEIVTLKVKAGIWGLMGGAIVIVPALVYFLIDKVD